LSHKLNIWSYEEEERAFTTQGIYIPVQVRELITGRAMSTQDFSMIRELVDRVNPAIEIIRAERVMEAL
jgi:hypothetical protein